MKMVIALCNSIILTMNVLSTVIAAELGCIDEEDRLVDWYYAYKLPRNLTHPNTRIADGVAYAFLLSSQPEIDDWTVSLLGIDTNQSMMGRTLSPLYDQPKSSDLAYVLYNDEDPSGHKSQVKGHSKGVLVINQNRGFWMMQSTPKYPSWPNESYTFPQSGRIYGQSFLCITINIDQADKIGTQFQYSTPNVYNYSMPPWTREKLPSLFDAVVNSKTVHSKPWFIVMDIQSAATVTFTSFAKHSKFGEDIYGDLVAPTLQSDLDVETWIHGSGEIPSVCSPYHVLNVEAVHLIPANFTFNTTSDHSKWAVSPGNAIQRWICLGDNNRMNSQKVRAGITVCRQCGRVWSVYTRSITKVQPCPVI